MENVTYYCAETLFASNGTIIGHVHTYTKAVSRIERRRKQESLKKKDETGIRETSKNKMKVYSAIVNATGA
uniref:Transposase n=1 Tax=Heterorhabditis bacteriophora TaxID=37862 RepID=A0A1I7XEY1_HETBA